MAWIILTGVAVIFLFLGFAYSLLGRWLYRWREQTRARLHFLSIAKEQGFLLHQQRKLLYQLALQVDREEPADLFWSCDKWELLILRFAQMAGQRQGDLREPQEFRSLLFTHWMKIEIEKREEQDALIDTRQLPELQGLYVLVDGAPPFKSQVLQNNDYYLTIRRPPVESEDFIWKDRQLSAHFWRENDADYRFHSSVLMGTLFEGVGALKINHTDVLQRTQKRSSIRVDINRSAYLYIILDEDRAWVLEEEPGLKCIVKNLSEGGCAVLIGGGANRELRVKVQFALQDNLPICMPGTVCSAKYDMASGRSLLHIKTDPLPLEAKNRRFQELFDILSSGGQDPSSMLVEKDANYNLA